MEATKRHMTRCPREGCNGPLRVRFDDYFDQYWECLLCNRSVDLVQEDEAGFAAAA